MKRLAVVICLLWMGAIFYLSSNIGEVSHRNSYKVVQIIQNYKAEVERHFGIKDISKTKMNYYVRKSAHILEFFTLSLLVGFTLSMFKAPPEASIIYILFIGLLYAVLDEFHQSFIIGRTSSVRDILIDFTGTCLGTLLYYLFHVVKNYHSLRKGSYAKHL